MPDASNDPIATLEELRSLEPLDEVATYPDDVLLDMRDAVIGALEQACNVSFVRRERTQNYADSPPRRMIALDRHRNVEILSVSVAGTELDAAALAALTVNSGGLVSRGGGYGPGFRRYGSVTYVEGYEEPPGIVKRAVRELTREWAQQARDSSLPARATSMSVGETDYRLVTAGERGAVFDLPIANTVVNLYRE